jgi:hypothetical protein
VKYEVASVLRRGKAPGNGLPNPIALQACTPAIVVKLAPELTERLRPPPYIATHISPSLPGAVRIILEPPVPILAVTLNVAPPSLLTLKLPLPLNSTSVLNYNYADDLAGMTGIVYYRLKMTDKDASYTYSNIVSLNISKSLAGFIVSLLPNPLEAKSGAVVHITSDTAENVMLKVISSNGAVLGIKYAAIAAGNTNINISELVHQPQGLYMLKVISADTYKNLGAVQFVIR